MRATATGQGGGSSATTTSGCRANNNAAGAARDRMGTPSLRRGGRTETPRPREVGRAHVEPSTGQALGGWKTPPTRRRSGMRRFCATARGVSRGRSLPSKRAAGEMATGRALCTHRQPGHRGGQLSCGIVVTVRGTGDSAGSRREDRQRPVHLHAREQRDEPQEAHGLSCVARSDCRGQMTAMALQPRPAPDPVPSGARLLSLAGGLVLCPCEEVERRTHARMTPVARIESKWAASIGVRSRSPSSWSRHSPRRSPRVHGI